MTARKRDRGHLIVTVAPGSICLRAISGVFGRAWPGHLVASGHSFASRTGLHESESRFLRGSSTLPLSFPCSRCLQGEYGPLWFLSKDRIDPESLNFKDGEAAYIWLEYWAVIAAGAAWIWLTFVDKHQKTERHWDVRAVEEFKRQFQTVSLLPLHGSPGR